MQRTIATLVTPDSPDSQLSLIFGLDHILTVSPLGPLRGPEVLRQGQGCRCQVINDYEGLVHRMKEVSWDGFPLAGHFPPAKSLYALIDLQQK
jgi:hypothetical protein